MKKYEFWEIANQRRVRGLSFHCWRGQFDFVQNFDTIVWAVGFLDLWPASIDVRYNKKWRTRVLKWATPNDADLGEFDSIENIYLETSQKKSLSKLDVHLRTIQIQGERPWAYFSASPEALTVKACDEIADRFIEVLPHAYGFSSVDTMPDTFLYHAGQPTQGFSEILLKRVEVFEQVKFLNPDNPESLAHRLLDVFEWNLLNENHIRTVVAGKTLDDWIESGSRGTLRQLRSNRYIWLVPDEVRFEVRSALLRLGCIVTPI